MPAKDWDTKIRLAQTIEGRLELLLDDLDGECRWWNLPAIAQAVASGSAESRKFAVGCARYYIKALYSAAKAHKKGMLSPAQEARFAQILERTSRFEDLFRSHGLQLRYVELTKSFRERAPAGPTSG